LVRFKREDNLNETEVGRLPTDWDTAEIDKMAHVSSGGTPSRKVDKYWQGDVNWLKSQEISKRFVYSTEERISREAMENSSADTIYPAGTVVVALYGATAGEVAMLRTSSTINQALAALQGREGRSVSSFLFYALLASKERLLRSTAGAAQQNLYLRSIKEFVIQAPGLTEQSRIATILSQFDELIENKKRQNQVLEDMAMAIFRSWFIKFDPFDQLTETELGGTPRGWKVDRVTRIIEFDPTVNLVEGRDYPFVTMELVSTRSLACEYFFKSSP
jgi:type I restriction enzyme S subunit